MDAGKAERMHAAACADAQAGVRAFSDLAGDAQRTLEAYAAQMAAELRAWRPVEAACVVRRGLYGSAAAAEAPSALSAIELGGDAADVLRTCASPAPEAPAIALAQRQDFDAAPAADYALPQKEGASRPGAARAVLSRKCAALLDEGGRLEPDAALAYAALHSRAFRGPLQQLPQIAALFHNDCMFIALRLLDSAHSGTSNGAAALRDAASRVAAAGRAALAAAELRLLDDIWRTLRDAPGSASAPQSPTQGEDASAGVRGESWDATRYGQLQRDTIARLGTVAGRALARTSQAARVLGAVLEAPSLVRVHRRLLQAVRDWAWEGLCVQRECVADAPLLVSGVLQPIADACAPLGPAAFSDGGKIEDALRIHTMTLVQLSNAFRRDELRAPLSDVVVAVTALHADSAMRRALLREVRDEMAAQ